jgi:Tol biopolymer transport system component/tRNA A-37 threonylcarbamoyl transferase component Bud32
MSLATGSRLGPYEILSALGAGGMGEVYRARDTKLHRDVAIKVLLPAVANDPDRLARFSREAQVLASLNHPNIAHIHGLEEANGVTALVLELVEGEDLAQRIARGPIPLDEALPIARQIAEALEAAHDHGIVHRDLKPANIKVRADGTVKVLDFGLAKAVDPTAGSSATAMNSPTLSIHATQAGIILGTAAYMSPEQARGKSVDKRTDIWAFGCVLFEMLTGTRAFPGDDATDTIIAVCTKNPDWSALSPTVPPAIGRLLKRSLDKDPKRRLDSAAAVRIDIDDAHTAAAEPKVRPSAPRLLPWGIAALLAIGLAVTLLYLRPQPAATPVMRFLVEPPFGVTRTTGLGFAIAPDGQTVAFVATAGGQSRIFTRRIDQTEPRAVAGTDGTTNNGLFWSPDSRSLAFGKTGGLYRVDLDGSAPRHLCDVPGGAGRNLTSGTWGSRGVIVFGTGDGPLWQISDSGGTATVLTTLDDTAQERIHAWPWFLPDGRHVLFLAMTRAQVEGVVWMIALDNPERRRVTESAGGAAYANGWLLTTRGTPRTLVAERFDTERLSGDQNPQLVSERLTTGNTGGGPGFSVAMNGTVVIDHRWLPLNQLTWVDRAGRVIGTIGPTATIPNFALAADDTTAVAGIMDRDVLKGDLWVFDPQRPEGNRLTFDGSYARPLWAADGRRVFVTGFPNFTLKSVTLGGTQPEPFDNPGGFIFFEDVTRDGRYLIMKSLAQPPGPMIWAQRIGAPDERRVLVDDQFRAEQPRLSPDGRWLAFTLFLPGGAQIVVQPFELKGDRLQVSRTGGSGAIWRADSRELYYESAAGLMAVAISQREGSLVAGPPQRLFALRTQGLINNMPHNVEAAANGQKFLVNAIVGDTDSAPLEVTVNWMAGLKK